MEFAANIARLTGHLHAAAETVLTGGPLEAAAEALLAAFEALPGAGRAGAFRVSGEVVTPLAGPSLSPAEIAALADTLSGVAREEIARGEGDRFTVRAGDGEEIDVISIRVPGEAPPIMVVMLRGPHTSVAGDVVRDLTEEVLRLAGLVVEDRRLRQLLMERQSLLEGVHATVPDAIVRIRGDGRIIDFGGRAEAIFGRRTQDVIGAHIGLLMPQVHARQHNQYIENFQRTGVRKLPNFGRRLQAVHADGTLFPVEIAISEITSSGEVEYVGLVRDITARVATEARMQSLREALETASRQSALGEFAASVAHELNQPLAAIANYMDAMDLHITDPGEAGVDLEFLRETARRAASRARIGAEIIRRMRRMTLRGETTPRMGDFHQAAADALVFLAPQIAFAGVEIERDIEGGSGQGADAQGWFDPVQMQQVLTNLINNAVDAMKSSPVRRLSVRTRVEGDVMEMAIADTGPGIPDARKAEVFESFVTTNPSGLGLGLAIVRRVVDAHGGTIAVSDSPGGGAVFTITLPRQFAAHEAGAGTDTQE